MILVKIELSKYIWEFGHRSWARLCKTIPGDRYWRWLWRWEEYTHSSQPLCAGCRRRTRIWDALLRCFTSKVIRIHWIWWNGCVQFTKFSEKWTCRYNGFFFIKKYTDIIFQSSLFGSMDDIIYDTRYVTSKCFNVLFQKCLPLVHQKFSLALYSLTLYLLKHFLAR